jgi:glycolate oxidase FAD binding subunit
VQGITKPTRLRRTQNALAGSGDVKVEHYWATSPEEIREVVDKCDVLATSYSIKRWAAPGLAVDLFELSRCQQMLEEMVPYFVDKERGIRVKADCDTKIAAVRAKYSQYSEGKRLGILNTRPNSKVIEFSPADQTVTISGGISVRRLNKYLAEAGQCIPLPPFRVIHHYASAGFTTTSVDQQIYLNLPHILQSQCGSWRDWVLGMKVVLANGEVVDVGSKVVKNVAGFDLHKLMIGSFATLGVIAEVTLRTFPLTNLPKPNVQEYPRLENTTGGIRSMYTWIQRVPLTDISSAIAATEPYVREVDLNTGVLWGFGQSEVDIQKPINGWMMRDRSGANNMSIDDPSQIALMKRAKSIFDPTNKLNPGVFGFI